MENITEKLKKISKEDIIFFLVGISFGLLFYMMYRYVRFQKKVEKEIMQALDEVKNTTIQAKAEAQKSSKTETNNSVSTETFPLKYGKQGEEVKMLQAWLSHNFEDTALEDSKEYQDAFFGKLTKEAVIKHTHRDKGAISKTFFENKVVPFFNKIEEE